MAITYHKGCIINALEEGKIDYLLHCVNTLGVMGGGLALQIKRKYPEVYKEYKGLCSLDWKDKNHLLGKPHYCQVEHGWVVNIFGQSDIGTHKRQVNYGAVSRAFYGITDQDYKVYGIPYNFGCGLAGGDWSIMLELIEFYFKNCNVKIYCLDPNMMTEQ